VRACWCAVLMLACNLGAPEQVTPAERERPVARQAVSASSGPERAGRWRRLPGDEAEGRRLARLGYVDGKRPAQGRGVLVHDRARATPGLRLMVSGHLPGAELQELDGEVKHRWQRSWTELFPHDPLAEDNPATGFWRRAALLPDGGVLAIFEGLGIARLDRDSRVVWARDNRAHHDLEVVGEVVWVLTRRTGVLPEVHPTETVLEDRVEALDLATGATRHEVSLVQAMYAGGLGPLGLPEEAEHRGDLLHTNSLVWLDGAHAGEVPAFARGHLLLSMLAIDALAVLDPDAGVVTWKRTGEFHRQHDPHPLPGGRVLLFDNQAGPERSRALIIDAHTGGALWSWDGGPHRLYSETCGTAAPLAGGHLLITESDGGRAFEIDADGAVVWAWASPHRVGKGGRWVATLFDVVAVARPGWLP
jgi:hypothetical protein